MHKIIRSGEIAPTPGGTIRFEGEEHGSAISFFHVNAETGKGADLHTHPYSETWIVRAGTGRFMADGETIEARQGDILVVSAGTIHGFKNTGSERLELICIHASPRIIQHDLPVTWPSK